MGKKLYVGNLSYGVSDSALEQLFSQYGTVQSAQVIQDRATGRSKGFGFVEMDNDAQAQAAIDGLHEREVDGRRLTVNEARPREDRGGGGGGGYGGGEAAEVAEVAEAAAVATAVVAAAAVMAVAEAAVTDRTRPRCLHSRRTGERTAVHVGFCARRAAFPPVFSWPCGVRAGRRLHIDPSSIQYGKPRMNPKHFHTPVSTRLRCPICHQPVYSRGGIHPQCAMRQSEPALHEPEEPVELVAGEEKVAVAVAVAARIARAQDQTVVRPAEPRPSRPPRPGRSLLNVRRRCRGRARAGIIPLSSL